MWFVTCMCVFLSLLGLCVGGDRKGEDLFTLWGAWGVKGIGWGFLVVNICCWNYKFLLYLVTFFSSYWYTNGTPYYMNCTWHSRIPRFLLAIMIDKSFSMYTISFCRWSYSMKKNIEIRTPLVQWKWYWFLNKDSSNISLREKQKFNHYLSSQNSRSE